MKWFKDIENIEQLRKRYKELLKVYHPDNGGNLADMQEINAEYDILYSVLSKEEYTDEQTSTYDKDEEDKAFKEVLSKIITLNVEAEIIGSWIWIVQGSYEYRELLKEIGFKYAPKKRSWCWHFGEWYRRSKREISLDEIREKYGSTRVKREAKRQYALD